MYRPSLDQDIKPLSEFRSHATTCIEQIRKTRRPMVITQHGRSAAVILNVTEYEMLMDRLELLEDIQQAEADIQEGRVMTQAEAERYLLKRI